MQKYKRILGRDRKGYRFNIIANLSKVKEALSVVNEYCDLNKLDKDLLVSVSRKANLVLHRKALLLILKNKGFTEPLIGFIMRRDRTTLISQYTDLRELKEIDLKYGLNSKEFRLAEDYEKNFQRAS